MSKWERVRLGDIVTITKGTKVEQTDPSLGAIRFLQIGDLRDDNCIKWCASSDKYTQITPDDVVIAWDGANAGTIGYGLSGVIGSTLAKISFNRPLVSEYIGLYLQGKFAYLQETCNGATIPHINRKALDNLQLPLPPLDEQKRIADVLDKASELIKKRKEQIRLMDELAKSLFIEMFGDLGYNPYNWPIMQLYELGENTGSIKCGPFGTQLNKEEYQVTGTPLWGIPEINHSFKLLPKDYLSDEKARSLEAYSVVTNDIVMSRKGNVGKCALYPSNFPKGIIHSDVLRIRPNQRKINSWFLIYQLHGSNYILSQISDVSNGAIMQGINVTKLKNINIHVPPLSLQNEFADRIAVIEQQKALLQDGLAKMETAYKALMQEYFE